MRSEEALVGTRVRVRDSLLRAELRRLEDYHGQVGKPKLRGPRRASGRRPDSAVLAPRAGEYRGGHLGQAVEAEERSLSFYYVDESDPDILVLCRHDGSFVAAFSGEGATREGIVEAAEEHRSARPRKDLFATSGNGVLRRSYTTIRNLMRQPDWDPYRGSARAVVHLGVLKSWVLF